MLMEEIAMTLAEALAQVDLEPGRTYDCVVNGQRVVVRVAPGIVTEPSAFDDSDVMLDAWCDLPTQGKRIPVNVVPGKVTTPDIPYIPGDDE